MDAHYFLLLLRVHSYLFCPDLMLMLILIPFCCYVSYSHY